MFRLYNVLFGEISFSRFQILIVSSLEQVMKLPSGIAPIESGPAGYISTPQIQAEWYRNEWDLPTRLISFTSQT